jgi:recombination protein RecA
MAKKKAENTVDITGTPQHKKETRDELLDIIKEAIELDFKHNKVAYYLDGSEDTPADVDAWVSTGSSILDISISNKRVGGYPLGRIIELQGLEASGKSLLAAHALSSTQKVGGVAILIDTENAISKDYLSAIGVNVDNLLYLQLETIEDIFDTIEKVIIKVRESNKNKPITIVVDSLAAATTKIEANANYDKDGYATDKAILLSKAYRKITNLIGKQHITLIVTNQLREKMGITWGDKFTASGGKATGFHASVRIRLKSVGKIKAMVNGVQRVVGISTVATVFKNRVGPPHAEAEFDIFFASGIDDYSGWLKKLIEYKVITGTAKKYKFVDKSSGETFEFSSNQFIKLMADNIELRDTLYNILCDKIIMPYSTINQFGIDDVVIDMKDEE